jgi:hypothetical protein
VLHLRAGQVRQAARLQLAQVAHERAGRADGGPVRLVHTESFERQDAELPRQLVGAHAGVELPPVALREQRTVHPRPGQRVVAA